MCQPHRSLPMLCTAPLRSLSFLLALIRGTHSSTGLAVEAELLDGDYPTGRVTVHPIAGSSVGGGTCARWALRASTRNERTGRCCSRRVTVAERARST